VVSPVDTPCCWSRSPALGISARLRLGAGRRTVRRPVRHVLHPRSRANPSRAHRIPLLDFGGVLFGAGGHLGDIGPLGRIGLSLYSWAFGTAGFGASFVLHR
jgi:hypothetical protein